MANEVRTYSPDRIKMIFGPHIVSGVADGTFITVEEMGEGTVSEAGAYGEVARAMSLDPRHAVTVTLQQTSKSNDFFSAAHTADKLSGGNGALPLLINDLRGTTMAAGTGWVVKKANKTFAKGLEAVEWNLEFVGEFVNGGNE